MKNGLRKLDKIFQPKSIAVIGASSRKGSVGYALIKNLILGEFEGIVYPVNPKRKSILGVKSYNKIKDIDDEIDLAVISTPARTVPAVVEECGQKGVHGIVIISAGFKEAGKEGEEMCDDIVSKARKYNMRIIGPNCLGFIKPSINLNASFASKNALPGNIAFISQSGALCTAILDWSVQQNVGFSYFVSIGSRIDIGFHDLIDYFGQDPNTTSILIYMESLENARTFLSAARAYSRNKPIIVLKAGRSDAGAAAAKSHTGSLAGNDAVYNAAFKRAGIIRVDTIEELFNSAKTLSIQPRPQGNRLAIITNAGGPGVIATDALMHQEGEVSTLSKRTITHLNKHLTENWSKGNPIDVLGDAGPERYKHALEACVKDKNVDGILVILTPQAMTDAKKIAKEISEVDCQGKTLLASWMGEKDVEEGRKIFRKNSIPVFRAPEKAVRIFMLMYNYSKNLDLLYETPATIPHAFKPKTKANKKIVNQVLSEGRNILTQPEIYKILSNYEIPVTRHYLVKNEEEAAKQAKKIGFPVAMKVCSLKILHKTEYGGVKLNIKNAEEAKDAFRSIMKCCGKKKNEVLGVMVEEMVNKKYELLIGGKKDPLFGPTIVFGMGGVAVEIFKDTNIGLPPLNMALSMRLIEETKIYKLLKGYRGMDGVDIKAIQFLLYKFAYLLADFPEIKEIDINPFSVDIEGGIVLDAKIILDDERIIKKTPYSHMVISPYPKEFITKFRMNNGEEALLRPIRPEDEPLEAEMFRNFSDETQRYRFFHSIENITHEMLVRYTQIDYDREIAIVAEVNEEGVKKMAGVVRIIHDPYEGSAEFAIVVADPWHHQGLGNRFTDFILDIAKKRGIEKIYGYFLKDNISMHNMFNKRGFTISEKDFDTFHAEKKL